MYKYNSKLDTIPSICYLTLWKDDIPTAWYKKVCPILKGLLRLSHSPQQVKAFNCSARPRLIFPATFRLKKKTPLNSLLFTLYCAHSLRSLRTMETDWYRREEEVRQGVSPRLPVYQRQYAQTRGPSSYQWCDPGQGVWCLTLFIFLVWLWCNLIMTNGVIDK